MHARQGLDVCFYLHAGTSGVWDGKVDKSKTKDYTLFSLTPQSLPRFGIQAPDFPSCFNGSDFQTLLHICWERMWDSLSCFNSTVKKQLILAHVLFYTWISSHILAQGQDLQLPGVNISRRELLPSMSPAVSCLPKSHSTLISLLVEFRISLRNSEASLLFLQCLLQGYLESVAENEEFIIFQTPVCCLKTYRKPAEKITVVSGWLLYSENWRL